MKFSFISINLNDFNAAKQVIDDCDLNNICHTYLLFQYKEELKSLLKFTTVPYYIVIDQDLNIINHGKKDVLLTLNDLNDA